MQIYIDVKNKEYAVTFIPKVLETYIKKRYSFIRGQRLEQYLQGLGVKQGIRELLLYAVDTMKVYERKNGFILEVDKNKTPLGSPYNISTLVKLINKGTANVRGYPLLDEAIMYVYQNKQLLLTTFMANERKKGRKK